jgi:hypothetical protein
MRLRMPKLQSGDQNILVLIGIGLNNLTRIRSMVMINYVVLSESEK